MKLIFQAREVYGQTRYYPANKNAEAICKLLGQKTLTAANLDVLRETEMEIEINWGPV